MTHHDDRPYAPPEDPLPVEDDAPTTPADAEEPFEPVDEFDAALPPLKFVNEERCH